MEDLRQTSTQLNHAVQGLNELMEEALRVAGQAAHNGRPDEIATIFNDATAHLKRATVTPKQIPPRRHHSTDDLRHVQDGFNGSLMPSELSAARPPTPRPSQPIRRHASPRLDEPVEPHHLGLPASLSRAYVPTARQRQTMRRRARSRIDDPVELHYQEFPILSRQYLRDERHPQGVRTKVFDPPARPTLIAPIEQSIPPPINAGAPPTPKTESSTTSHGSSNATTITVDKLDLKHPRKRHISIPAGQDISLGRHHHRQPIAREWPTFRKRMTALIACLNTVFIGLIVGIYVSLRTTPHSQNASADLDRPEKCHAFNIRSKTPSIGSSWEMFCKQNKQ